MLDKWDYGCNQNFSDQKSFASTKIWNKMHINVYMMGRPFSMYTVISMYTEILSYGRATHIYWMENNPDGHLLKVLVFLFLYLESNQVIILWKVSKRNRKE